MRKINKLILCCSVTCENTIIVLFVLLCIFLPGCRTKTAYVPVHSSSVVSELRRDTLVEVRLPLLRDSISTTDTLSFLENKYASSIAFWSNNRLLHSLVVKEVSVPIKIEYIERFRTDSISVPYPVEHIVEKNVLRWWQKVLMCAGGLLFTYFIIRVGKRSAFF